MHAELEQLVPDEASAPFENQLQRDSVHSRQGRNELGAT